MKILHVLISKGFAGSELYAINLLNHQSQNHQTFLIKNSKSDANKYNKFLNINVKTFKIFRIDKNLNTITVHVYY